MPLTRHDLVLLLGGLAIAGSLHGPLRAESEAALGANYYGNGSGMSVFTPEVRWKADLNPRTQAALDFSVDAVSAASFDYGKQSRTHRLDPARQGQCTTCHVATDALSGASRNYRETRKGFAVRVARRLGPERRAQLKAAYQGNRENDYASDAYSLGTAWDFNDANSTLGLQVTLMKDQVTAVTRAGFSEPLDSLGGDLNFSQVLTPRTVADFGYSYARAEGYQGNPYAYLEIGNDKDHPVRAVHPSLKTRHVGTARLKQGLSPGLALELGYRYYADDWGVEGHNAELSLSQAVGKLVLEPFARFYAQPQGAGFFRNFYGAPQAYMSRDLKLAPHQTTLLGLSLHGKLGAHFGTELSYSRYTRQDSLDYQRYFADGPEQADLVQLVLTYE